MVAGIQYQQNPVTISRRTRSGASQLIHDSLIDGGLQTAGGCAALPKSQLCYSRKSVDLTSRPLPVCCVV
jgi:hypothetical protein